MSGLFGVGLRGKRWGWVRGVFGVVSIGREVRLGFLGFVFFYFCVVGRLLGLLGFGFFG